MSQTILPGTPPIAINLRRSARARRIALRISGVDGRVTLSLPKGVREAEGLRFARDREDWLRRVLAARPPFCPVAFGAAVPVEGRRRVVTPGCRLALEPDRIVVPGAAAQAGPRVAALLRLLARDRLAEAVARHATALGLVGAAAGAGPAAPACGAPEPWRVKGARQAESMNDPPLADPSALPGSTGRQEGAPGRAVDQDEVDTDAARATIAARPDWRAPTAAAARRGVAPAALVLRDTRARWGSCSSDGRLMFSWRLVMAPPPVLDYVAAHEVAHLVEMNHAPAFWSLVARLFPGFEAPRRWLRTEGAGLHLWRFEG